MKLYLAEDPRSFLQDQIESFVRESPANRLNGIDGGPIFENPLVGFASGDDPLFQQYKSIIGPFHLTPREFIRSAGEQNPTDENTSMDELTVVCWVLPISRETRLSNRREDSAPSKRWAHTKYHGEKFNDVLRRHMVEILQAAGRVAVAPVLSPLFKVYDDGVEGAPASNWSERHAMYAAGLGTFSLSDGFISSRGMAMRCGSIVTNLTITPDQRPAGGHLSNCLFFFDGSCSKCAERCPAGAISQGGHDKLKCQNYLDSMRGLCIEAYGVDTVCCGLCQTGVPCEAVSPRRRA